MAVINIDGVATQIAADRSVRPRIARLAVIDALPAVVDDPDLYDRSAGALTDAGAAHIRTVVATVPLTKYRQVSRTARHVLWTVGVAVVLLLGGAAAGHAIAGARPPVASPAEVTAGAQASVEADCVTAWNNQGTYGPKTVAGDFANAGPTSVSVGSPANAPGFCLITIIAPAGLDVQFEQLPSGQWSEAGGGQFSTLGSSITTNINAYGDTQGNITLGSPPAPSIAGSGH